MLTSPARASPDDDREHDLCSEKQSFLKRGNPKKKPSFSLQTYAPLKKLTPPFRKKKASFSLQTGAPLPKSEANGCRRRAKVENRSKIWNRRSIRLQRKVNSPPKFRYPIRKKKPSFSLQTGARRRNSGANGPRRRAKVKNEVGR